MKRKTKKRIIKWVKNILNYSEKPLIKYNINDYMYIQITEQGWVHLNKEVGKII